MPSVYDLHFHSLYSDGDRTPADMVAAAAGLDLGVSHLALTDHDTFAGCPEFMAACRARGITGFVAAEVGGVHPAFPMFEMHLVAVLGTAWNDATARRAEMFRSYWEGQRRVEIGNVNHFIACAAEQGHVIAFGDVERKARETVARYAGRIDPAFVPPVTFNALRALLREKGLETRNYRDPGSFERTVWTRNGARPAAKPPLTGAFEALRASGTAVIMAHPMLYIWTMDDARRALADLKREFNLVALEGYYDGRLFSEWTALAAETGLLVSAGSDCHTAWPPEKFAVAEDGDAAFKRLTAVLAAAGKG
jgi:3',5'-nucleoside bisphosphate phosphatase